MSSLRTDVPLFLLKETQGVFVSTLVEENDRRSPSFPNFFEQESGVPSPAVVRGEKAAADLIDCHFNIGINSGTQFSIAIFPRPLLKISSKV